MKNFIITPEAIAELMFEYWNELCSDCYSRQNVVLEQNNLYYLALSEKTGQSNRSNCDKFTFEDFNTIKSTGIYNKISELSHITALSQSVNETVKYFQVQNEELENYIKKIVYDTLPRKLIKKSVIHIQYLADKSNDWNYHDKTNQLAMHLILKSKKDDPIIIQSCYELGSLNFRQEG